MTETMAIESIMSTENIVMNTQKTVKTTKNGMQDIKVFLEQNSIMNWIWKKNSLLGLSIAYNIVMLHKGTIKFEKNREVGTKVIVTLPRK